MSPLQKLLAALLAGLVLSLLVVVLGVAYVRGGDTKVSLTQTPAANSTIPTIEEGEEQLQEKDLVEDTTTTSSTTTTTFPGMLPETTTSSPPTTRLGPAVDGSGAVLMAPGSPTTRQLSSGSCQGLAEPGATDIRCEQFRARGADLVWMTQSTREGVLGAGRGRTIQVFERSGSGQWTVVLEKIDVGASQYRSVNVRVADVSGDGSLDAVFGFRSASSSLLELDVVEGPGTVTAHRIASNGSARVSTGQLDVWYSTGAISTHEVIRVVEGVFRVISSEQVPTSEVPPSQL